MFIDQTFLPNSNSLGLCPNKPIQTSNIRTIIWKRLSQLSQNSQVIKERIQPSDIQQGNIGDCYFLAAISALAQNQYNILRIFGKKELQDLTKNKHGIYKIILNIGGQPEQIIIDDMIPVYEKSLRPVYCRPVNNQFWVVMLEKAWAKVNGSYCNISSGNPHQVLNKFSVAPVFYYNIHEYFYEKGNRKNIKQTIDFEQKLWQHIIQGHKQNFAMCSSTRSITYINGVKSSHSYTLLAAYEFEHKSKRYRVLKVRNPWGNTEYNGQLSQYDPIWKQVSIRIRQEIFQKSENDGIFLIPFEIFLINFESVNICHCKQQYNYIYKAFQLNNNKNIKNSLNSSYTNYFQLFIQQDGELYLTFQKNYKKDYTVNKYLKNGVSKILLSQQVHESVQINNTISISNRNNNINKYDYVNNYQFIDCALQTTLADVTIRCRHMKKGHYIIMIQNQQSNIQQYQQQSFLSSASRSHGTLSTYSNTICTLNRINQPVGFLRKYFINHALCYNNDKKKIGEYQKDWIAKKLLSESGYGYVCISLHENGLKKLEITFNKSFIQEAGYRLLLDNESNINMNSSKGNDNIITVIIEPGNLVIFLFKVDFISPCQRLVFPPKGFDVKKII